MQTKERSWLDDLEPREERFTFKSVRYLLMEPSAAAISAWRTVLLEGTQVGVKVGVLVAVLVAVLVGVLVGGQGTPAVW